MLQATIFPYIVQYKGYIYCHNTSLNNIQMVNEANNKINQWLLERRFINWLRLIEKGVGGALFNVNHLHTFD